MFIISTTIQRHLSHAARGLWLLLALAALLAGCAGFGPARPNAGATSPDGASGTLLDPPKELADFTLTSHTGAPLSLSDLRGSPVLLFFGYTHCPDVCPLTLAEWRKVKQQLGDAASDVAFVFVSVDGKRDTPEVLARFVDAHDPAFIGLTGDEATLRTIAEDFGVHFHSHAAEGGDAAALVDHSSYSFLINREGQLHMLYSYGISADVISRDIQELLARS